MTTTVRTAEGRKRVAIAVVAVAAVLLVGAVVSYLISPISLPWERAEARLATSAEVAAGIVHVTGTTDLPDGARVELVFVREAEIQDVRHVGNPSHLLRAIVDVRNAERPRSPARSASSPMPSAVNVARPSRS